MNWQDVPPSPLNAGPGNAVLDFGDFYISYARDTSGCLFGLGAGGEETALVKGKQFLILNGDHRAAYERLAPDGYDACLGYFKDQPTRARSPWSNEIK